MKTVNSKLTQFIDLEQGTDAWHSFRNGKIGASDIPAIIEAKGAHKKRSQLLEEKLGLRTENHSDFTLAMFREGHDWELKAREYLNHGREDKFIPTVAQRTDEERFFASLDGYLESENLVLEVKSTVKEDYIELVTAGVCPPAWDAQIQWQMFCSGADDALLCVVNRTLSTITTLKIERNSQKILDLVNAAQAFLDDMDYKNIGVSEAYSGDIDVFRLVQIEDAVRQAKEALKTLETESKAIADDLLKRYQCRKLVSGILTVEKIDRVGAVDYSRIPELAGVDLDRYRKKGSSYVKISFKKPSGEVLTDETKGNEQ